MDETPPRLEQLENELRHKAFILAGKEPAQKSRDHLIRGFGARLIMIESSREFLRNLLSGRTAVLSVEEAAAAAVHLNSFYSNIFGAVDNLAWFLQYKHSLLPDAKESSGRDRLSVGLFRKDFRAALEAKDPSFYESLPSATAFESLRKFRDPGAHRIPLMIPRGAVDPKNVDEYQRREEAAAAGIEKGERYRTGIARAEELAILLPKFTLSSEGPEQVADVTEEIERAERLFYDVAVAVLDHLLASALRLP
jgi:hypothetical protein